MRRNVGRGASNPKKLSFATCNLTSSLQDHKDALLCIVQSHIVSNTARQDQRATRNVETETCLGAAVQVTNGSIPRSTKIVRTVARRSTILVRALPNGSSADLYKMNVFLPCFEARKPLGQLDLGDEFVYEYGSYQRVETTIVTPTGVSSGRLASHFLLDTARIIATVRYNVS